MSKDNNQKTNSGNRFHIQHVKENGFTSKAAMDKVPTVGLKKVIANNHKTKRG